MPLNDFDRYCYACGADAPVDAPLHCNCGNPLSLRAHARPDRALFEQTPASLWHYRALLPIADDANVVTLQEGATPLVTAPRVAAKHGLAEVRLKNEGANPTASFKDRQVAVGISHAKEIGAKTVACVSSGNVAAATAAYAARAGMNAVVFMHAHASEAKAVQAALYGATVVPVDSPAPSAVFDLCIEACDKWGWYHLSSAGIYEPYNVEGAKTIAYELWQQYGGDLPDWIVAPVGGGGLLGGIWRGFLDLKRLGLIEGIPRFAGVQPDGCAVLDRAIRNNETFLESLEMPWPDPATIAGGLADDILFDGHTALPAIRETQGAAPVVSDDEIVAAVRDLASSEGLACEFCSAVTIAALDRIPGVGQGTRVCCIITGNGLKDVPWHARNYTLPEAIPATVAAVEARFQEGEWQRG